MSNEDRYTAARSAGSQLIASLRGIADMPAEARTVPMAEDVMRRAAGALDGLVNAPIPMRLLCPSCGALHLDEGEYAEKPHHTHACQACGEVWRPAVVPTVGVRFLPGFQNEGSAAKAATSNEREHRAGGCDEYRRK
jgi:hypothetical protein